MSLGRREILQLALGAVAGLACQRGTRRRDEMTERDQSPMPVLFVGHGTPMNGIEDNVWSRGFGRLGQAMETPAAILAVSAHWYRSGTYLTGNARPPTIHDFGGFPRKLYEIEYPARGDVALARRIRDMLAERRAGLRDDWGLDHGTWTVLRHAWPAADVPVLQLSIDARLEPSEHLAIGGALAPLRREGVLILASGNITHNLPHAMGSIRSGRTEQPPWATAFDADVAAALEQRDHDFLARALDTDTGRQSHPTPDHYLPLLYAAGATGEADEVDFPIEGFDLGSVSMRAVRFGRA